MPLNIGSERRSPRDPIWVRLTAVAFVGLCFVVLGCLLMENEVNYPAWRTLPARQLIAHHAAVEAGLRTTMFPAMALHLVFETVLLVRPPRDLGRRPILGVLASFLAVLIVSFVFQVPLHREITAGGGPSALEALIRSHVLLRRPLELAAAAASLWVLWRVVSREQAHLTRP